MINGIDGSDNSGASVSNAGDVNGDGFDDLIIGVPSADNGANTNSGSAFVVFGTVNTSVFELSQIENAATGGFEIDGLATNDVLGTSVSGGGDVNGDGLADLIVGVPQKGASPGKTYVIFGKNNTTAVDIAGIEAGTSNQGFMIEGEVNGDDVGRSVSLAGDVNGDGFDDVIIGAPGDGPPFGYYGSSFVVFGKSTGSTVQLSDIDNGSGDGFVFKANSASDYLGQSVSAAGDVNGDGLDDLIVGSPETGRPGASYVVFGKDSNTEVDITAIENGVGGFVIDGANVGDKVGVSVSDAGDVNGDGLADLIVGAYQYDGGVGAAYVVFGKSGNTTAVDLNALGTEGFLLDGIDANDYAGSSVSGLGDINGDGLDDLIVSAPFADPTAPRSEAGQSYVVYGRTATTDIDLTQIESGTGTLGFMINGFGSGDRAGVSVSAAGDVNGDGFEDILVGADRDDPNNGDAGASFVIFGGNFNNLNTTIGDAANNTFTGTAGADRLIGGRGDDTITSNGADVIRGGEGDDVIQVNAFDFADIDGGTGTDTLELVGGIGILDLSSIDNESLDSIERIDLVRGTGSHANTLRITPDELTRMSDNNVLRVNGEANDTVNLLGGTWVAATPPTVTDGGGITYDRYENGNATIEIEQGIVVTGLPIPTVGLGTPAGNTNGTGFVIHGVRLSDISGYDVSGAGDVNGDGLDDLIIGARQADGVGDGTNSSGDTYVVFGKTGGGIVQLSDVAPTAGGPGTGGFVIYGADANDGAGFSVNGVGDINGDGLDDLIVGASFASQPQSRSGAAYVVLGKTDAGRIDLSNIELGTPNTEGFVMNGATNNDRAGTSVGTAGDFNGDGFDDFLVGAFGASNNARLGHTYIVFGDGTLPAADVDFSAIDAGTAPGIMIEGISVNDRAGRASSTIGDFNGDGFDDVLIGAFYDDPNSNTNSGSAFIVYGRAGAATSNTTIELSAVQNGTGGFVINGVTGNDYAGREVSGIGDFNGDGLSDIIISAENRDVDAATSVTTDEGAAYIIYGTTAAFTNVELSDVEASSNNLGFVLNGAVAGDLAGFGVTDIGDFNGDGFDDVLVGAPGNTGGVGKGYVVLGRAGNSGSAVELFDVEAGIGGFVLTGIAGDDAAGRSVSAAGDVNGDGFDDLIIGAPENDPNGGHSGSSFVVFGSNVSGAVTDVGTTASETLSGTFAADVIYAGFGNDTIDNIGAGDRVSGGEGADIFDFLDVAGQSTIIDFSPLNTAPAGNTTQDDRIDLTAFTVLGNNISGLVITDVGNGGSDALIQVDADTSIYLVGVTASDLDNGDFIF